jgi:L-ascorbate metabolism protein UlaG (beta-lactamase superfamily)
MRILPLGILLALPVLAATPPEEFSTTAGAVKITPIQHASLMIEAAGKVVYVDPASGSYDSGPSADYIFITDIHGDHLSPKVIDKLKKPGTVIVAPQAAAAQVPGAIIMANGQTKNVGPFIVEAIPMYNLVRGPEPGKFYHDKGRGNGYVLTYGGKRFYFSGDTEAIPEMLALKNIDVAFVCMNLPPTMSAAEAAAGVKVFHPAIVYPYHYRGQDLQVFVKGLEGTGIDVRLRDWYAK